MPANDRPGPAYKPRVNYLRRRPRPGALVRPPEGVPLPLERDQQQEGMADGTPPTQGEPAQDDLRRGVRDTHSSEELDQTRQRQK